MRFNPALTVPAPPGTVVTLRITGPRPGPRIAVPGFRWFWLKYVRGFEPAKHCGACLHGVYSHIVAGWKTFRGGAGLVRVPGPLPCTEVATPWDALYLCGVTAQWAKNLHVAVVPAAGELVTVPMPHDPRFTVHFENARALPIPEIADGWGGLPTAHTRCRNWRFGMACYVEDTAAR